MNLNALHISKTVAVLIILGIIVAAAIAFTLMKGDEPEETVTVSGDSTSTAEANFVSLATELDSIVFDTAILSDPRFLALENIHTAITPEPQGRTDPFSSAD
ncbi:MAG TPA: hypothetical protein VEA36_00085 [Candidatus Paceibacterota bacterium]|nr:hypothetical protein [Candidatus Paceibacterota bacterium]